MCSVCLEIFIHRRIKTRLLRFRSYASVSIIVMDTANPVSVIYAAKRIVQNYDTLDVLYLNNSTIRIDHFNWDVLKQALLTFRLAYFCSTGRVSKDSKNFVSVRGSGATDLGFNRDFCQQVLSPFILVMELKSLLQEGELPGRVVWTGSSTCRYSFSWLLYKLLLLQFRRPSALQRRRLVLWFEILCTPSSTCFK